MRLVDVGVARSSAGQEPGRRLLRISDEIESWITRLSPDAVAVERVFAQHNLQTVTGTSQVAGLAMVAAVRAGVPLALHTPSEVKAAVTGHGRAEKAQVQQMVRRLLDLTEVPRPADAADALALAITHAWRAHVVGTVHSASAKQTPAQRKWAEARSRANSARQDPRLAQRQ